MRSKWEVVKLGKVCKYIARGVTPMYSKEGVLVLNQRCVRDTVVNFALARRTNADKKKIALDKLLILGDVLINSTGVGTLGRVAQILALDEPTTVDSHVTIVRPNDLLEKRFLGYVLKSKQVEIEHLAQGSTGQTELSRVRLGDEISFPLPPLSDQKAIANTLSCLDAKIEINNKINANLEAQAQAIFKNWFVDFEPFKDGEFVESELGLIPKGWRVGKLSTFFDFVKGKKPIVSVKTGSDKLLPYLTKTVIDGTLPLEYSDPDGLTTIEKEDVFMLMDGANSSNVYRGYDGILGSTFSKLEIYDISYRELLYIFLKYWENEIKTHNTGSAIPHADKNYIHRMLVPIATNQTFVLFSKLTEAIQKQIITNSQQSTILAALRDLLLPKLMSGEIIVPIETH